MRASLLEELADRDERSEVEQSGDITFEVRGRTMLRLSADGRIWVAREGEERLAATDKEVVDAMRAFMRAMGYLKGKALGKRGRQVVRDEQLKRARARGPESPAAASRLRVMTAADRKPHACACACGGLDAHIENVKAARCACPGCTNLYLHGDPEGAKDG